MRNAFVALALALCINACGGKSSPTPTGPSNTAPSRIIGLNGNMAFGNIQVGASFTATLEIRNSGNSVLTVTAVTAPAPYTVDWTNGTIAAGAMQTVTVTFSPVLERAYSGTLTVSGDQTSGTSTIALSGTGTRPPGPRTIFGPGQYLVGSDVAPGRYYSDPSDACYWERQSGLGGTLADILANEFVGFNAGQWIVDIVRSDTAFETDEDCGTWYPTPRRGLEADITPGVWLVGSQITPGRYRANVAAGCYWERMRHFEGTLRGIIANDFVSAAGQKFVDIRSSDAGFHSDSDCGTWTRVPSLTGPSHDTDARQSNSEIESNWETYRQKLGRLGIH